MKRRNAILAALGVLLVGAALVAILTGGPRLQRSAFDAAHEGMTLDEMTAAVGLPPGDYMSRSLGRVRYTFLHSPPPPGCTHVEWIADDGAALYVHFDATGHAGFVHRFTPPPDGRSFWQRLRARLGL